MKDKMIACIQCKRPFVFSGAEQERFLTLGFDIPKCCPDCRKKKSEIIEINERQKNNNNKRCKSRREAY